MVPCAFCERPLVCDGCRSEYTPASAEQYEALSRPELPIVCAECGQTLVCHWCKTPYDGSPDDQPDRSTSEAL